MLLNEVGEDLDITGDGSPREGRVRGDLIDDPSNAFVRGKGLGDIVELKAG